MLKCWKDRKNYEYEFLKKIILAFFGLSFLYVAHDISNWSSLKQKQYLYAVNTEGVKIAL